jgi:hypothetical protein
VSSGFQVRIPCVRLAAEAWIGGRSMHFVVREPEGDVPLFISLQIPGPPASVLCGVMSGVAFVSSEPLPSACRIVFIRVPDTPRLDGTNRYFDPVSAAIAAFTREFLGTSPNQVTTQDQAMFASMLDREHLDASERR